MKEADFFVYADDAKLFNHIQNANDVLALQTDLNRMASGINDWSLKLIISKCRVVSYGRKRNVIKHNYFITNRNIEQIERAEYITDLAVVFDPQLNFSLHIKEKVNKAYSRLGILRRNFKYMSLEVFVCYIKQWLDHI